jgi:hypothetical protein
MRKFPLYIIDRAGQFTTLEFPSYEDQCAAADKWEADGHETYFNYLNAVLRYDHYKRFDKAQGAK